MNGPELLKLINNRQSDRAYISTPVEREKLERILEAGRLAPSACNSQPWKFIVVDNPELKNKIADFDGRDISKIDDGVKGSNAHQNAGEDISGFLVHFSSHNNQLAGNIYRARSSSRRRRFSSGVPIVMRSLSSSRFSLLK